MVENCKMNVEFLCSDEALQLLYDKAEAMERENIVTFSGRKVLIEGSKLYPNVWLETQPMGGEMYAKRNMEVALNNQLIFMDAQREDGRIPGMISVREGRLASDFAWFQGYCFPTPALHMYYLAGKDKAYLERLYGTLEKFDAYLWKYRDSNGDGCLETWCIWDTGEDGSVRLKGAPEFWAGEKAPAGIGRVPYASMDVMGFSAEGRRTLAKIARLLRNGKEDYWKNETKKVIDKIQEYLWIDEKGACYDRDCDNLFMDILLHNNLRVMYYGGFTQYMADRFIKEHLLNPEEFWTKMPLPSVAVNDPSYRNDSFNNWSGQPQGLTLQRAIQALENYGHYAEITMIGRKFLGAMKEHRLFVQQFDPFTGKPAMELDGYGPTILAVLEYISKMYGVYIGYDEIEFNGIASPKRQYMQTWGEFTYTLCGDETEFAGSINDKKVFQCSANVRVVTDITGKPVKIIGIDNIEHEITVKAEGIECKLRIHPNEEYAFEGKEWKRIKKTVF